MNKIQEIEKFVRNDMEWLCSAHDFLHIERVVANVRQICEMERNWNTDIAIPSAYLHEYFDEKFFDIAKLEEREKRLIDFFKTINILDEYQRQIIYIIKNVWYGKSLSRPDDFVYTPEFQIVEDADRLESIWTIAIARMFTYGWKKGRVIYDPHIPPSVMNGYSQYKDDSEKSTSFNHFYEKLLLIKDLMHTKSWRILAEPRHNRMLRYIEDFLWEWNWTIDK